MAADVKNCSGFIFFFFFFLSTRVLIRIALFVRDSLRLCHLDSVLRQRYHIVNDSAASVDIVAAATAR